MTYITQNHTDESHTSHGPNSTCLLDPVIPPICKYGDPAFCYERLHEDEHTKGEGDEGEREVVEDGHGGGKGFLGGVVGVG
jgi:hypothetical protein